MSDEPPIKRRRNGRISSLEEEVLVLSRDLVVYDKSKACLLVPGEYELGVQAADGAEKKKLFKTWESFAGKVSGFFVFILTCLKKFSLYNSGFNPQRIVFAEFYPPTPPAFNLGL